MARIEHLFQQKAGNVLSIYFTAGYPKLEQTMDIIKTLDNAGVDMIEIGIPFSDPMADGLTIQESNDMALKNGMTLALLFKQLSDVRSVTQMPLVMMGYLNPILQYGFEAFCKSAKACGIDAFIIPDIPLKEYNTTYKAILDRYDLKLIFLITPQTSDNRVRLIDSLSGGFVYMVTTSAITGNQQGFSDIHQQHMQRVKDLSLTNPVLAGFGISCKADFEVVNKYVNGAIIGSRFIQVLKNAGSQQEQVIRAFIASIR